MPQLKKLDVSPSLAILLSGVLIAGAILFVNFYAPSQAAFPTDATGDLQTLSIRPAGGFDHWRGSKDAAIVLVEYSDFQCPYCASIHPTLARIVEESQGEVAWVYRHFPLESIHPQARPAAVASECVAAQLGDEGFWAFADTIFNNQRSVGTAYYAQVAAELGADEGLFASCVASGQFDKKVDADYAEAVDNGGQGTPFTVLTTRGGLQVPFAGALPYAQIKAVIQAAASRQ